MPLAVLVYSGSFGQNVVKRVRFHALMRSSVFRIHFGQTGVKLSSLTVMKDGPGQDRKLGLLTE